MTRNAAFVLIGLFVAVPAFSTDYFAVAGDVGQYAVPAAALGIAIWKKDWKGCLQFCEAYAATLAVAYGLKYTVNETRPDGGTRSFPSGHTASAACGAAFLDIRYGPAWGLPAYGAAALVGMSRIESNSHYPLDVVAGAAIGILANVAFTRARIPHASVAPVSVPGGFGAVATFNW
jgi:membrane-associated phospholipid phosphatase